MNTEPRPDLRCFEDKFSDSNSQASLMTMGSYRSLNPIVILDCYLSPRLWQSDGIANSYDIQRFRFCALLYVHASNQRTQSNYESPSLRAWRYKTYGGLPQLAERAYQNQLRAEQIE